MGLGRQRAVQDELLIGWHEVPLVPGHLVYDRLNGLLKGAGFDREVEALCTAPPPQSISGCRTPAGGPQAVRCTAAGGEVMPSVCQPFRLLVPKIQRTLMI